MRKPTNRRIYRVGAAYEIPLFLIPTTLTTLHVCAINAVISRTVPCRTDESSFRFGRFPLRNSLVPRVSYDIFCHENISIFLYPSYRVPPCALDFLLRHFSSVRSRHVNESLRDNKSILVRAAYLSRLSRPFAS